MITAGAPALPQQLLLEQLVDGGIAVLPIGPESEQMLVQIRRDGDLPTRIVAAPEIVGLS